MAKLRLQYWIISEKSAVKHIIDNCVTCFWSNGHTKYLAISLNWSKYWASYAFETCISPSEKKIFL